MDKLAKTKAAIERKQQSSIQVQQEELYKELLRRGLTLQSEQPREAPKTFKEFVSVVKPEFVWYDHCNKLAEVVERIVSGELTRVLIWLPPRHAKSELFSRLLTAYWLLKRPETWVGLSSFGADLADSLSYDALLNYKLWGGALDPQAQAKNHWRTDKRGGMWSAGAFGAILGKGASLLVADDLHKNYSDVDSISKLEKLYNWWQSTWSTRANLTAGIPPCFVVVMQRWSERDICGWLLNKPDNEPWHVVCLDLEHDTAPIDLPPNCTLEPDDRAEGELLCPEIVSPQLLRQWKSDRFFYNAQYAQRPGKAVGSLCSRSEFGFVDAKDVPEFKTLYRAWDTALSNDKNADWTCGVLFGYDNGGNIWILDVIRQQLSSPDVRQLILDTALSDPPGTVVAIEKASASYSIVKDLEADKTFLRIPLVPITVHGRSGNLLSRAAGVFSTIRTGRFKVVKAGWTEDYVEEFLRFTGQKTDIDDQVSATSIGFSAVQEFGGGSEDVRTDVNPYTQDYVRELVRLNQRTRNKPKQQWRPF